MKRTASIACAFGAVALGAGAALWARRRLVVVTVEGRSMEPTFEDGDRVLVRRRSLADVRNGDVVVLEPPETSDYLSAPPKPPRADDRPRPRSGKTGRHRKAPPARARRMAPREQGGRVWNVKRVVALPGDRVPTGIPGEGGTVPSGRLAVLGDNPDSVDSRQRGLFPGDRILGVVLRRIGRGADAPAGRADASSTRAHAPNALADGPNRQL